MVIAVPPPPMVTAVLPLTVRLHLPLVPSRSPPVCYKLVQLFLIRSSQDKKFVCETALINMTNRVSPSILLLKLEASLKHKDPRVREKLCMCFGGSVPHLNAGLEFSWVVKVKTQVASGTMHHLTIEDVDASKKKSLLEAKMWEKPWENFISLHEINHLGLLKDRKRIRRARK